MALVFLLGDTTPLVWKEETVVMEQADLKLCYQLR